jgi:zinc transport system substrate-binding protein
MNSAKYPLFLLILLTLFGPGGCADRADAPAGDGLLVSMRPLALIAREVAGPEITVRALAGNTDPHHYAPGVADRAAMERALLVVWLGPQMEGALARQLAQLPDQRKLQLLEQGGYEFGGAAPADLHVWLRPRNAAVIAAQVAQRLAVLQPAHADSFKRRARDFSRRMANLQKVLDRALWGYRDVPIVVTHDAYGHFFGPAGVETLALSDAGAGGHGARALLKLRQRLDAGGSSEGCLFGEVPPNPRDRQTAAGLGLKYAALDPLGVMLPAEASYEDLVLSLLEQARACLARVPDTSQPADATAD